MRKRKKIKNKNKHYETQRLGSENEMFREAKFCFLIHVLLLSLKSETFSIILRVCHLSHQRKFWFPFFEKGYSRSFYFFRFHSLTDHLCWNVPASESLHSLWTQLNWAGLPCCTATVIFPDLSVCLRNRSALFFMQIWVLGGVCSSFNEPTSFCYELIPLISFWHQLKQFLK